MKKYWEKWKRSFAILLGITLLMGQIELPVYAETSSEESASGSGSMSTDIMTVSGNALNNSVPGTVSGNDISSVTSDAVRDVQDVIYALPTVEEVEAMNSEDRNAAYTLAQMAYEAYEALLEEEQAQVDTTKVEALFAYFNGMASLAAEAGPFTITKNGSPAEANKDYTWDDTTKILTINTTEALTISMADGQTTSANARIMAGEGTGETQIDLNLTLAGVNITAPANHTALYTSGQLTITLAEGSTNTLTGGTSSNSSYGISAVGALSISGGGTLHVDGGAVSDSYLSYSAGIYSNTSITIEGGTVEAAGGSSNSVSYGILASNGNSDESPTITINGGTVTAIGGNASSASRGMSAKGSITINGGSVEATGSTATKSYGLNTTYSNITINSGNVTATGNTGGIQGTFSTGTEGKAIIHASSISDQSGKTNNTWKGIIFEGRGATTTGYDGKVYGDLTLEKDFTVNGGEVLTIPVGTTLTLNKDMTLTNKGIINNNGIIDVTNGNLAGESVGGSGKIIKNGAMVFGPFLVTGGTGTTAPCEWMELEKTLTINTSEALTISMAEGVTTPVPACITAKNTSQTANPTYDALNLTLDGVHITTQDGDSALGSDAFNTAALKGGAVTITLKGSNTLTGGNSDKSSYGIYATGELKIGGDENATLHAAGGTVTDNSGSRYSAGICSNASITITSGTVEATGGTSSNGSYGIYANALEGNPTITINGGNVTAIGGSATTTSCGMSANGAITINGGSVEATGGTANNSYGISSSSYNISITGGTGTAKTTGTSAPNKGAMNKAPDFTNVGSNQKNTDTTMNWGPVPSITTQPDNATVNAGETATFTVAAENATSYKWQVKKGEAEWADVDGATTASYTTGATTTDMNGNQYRCVVDNEYGSVESNAATLTVTCTVTYDGNGTDSGSVPVDATSYNPDAQVTVLGNTGYLAKTGYIFGGWNTESDGTGTDYAEGDILTITANTTLYAKWEAKPEEPKPEEPKPEEPTTPEQPVEPEKPVEPTKPVEPEKPTEPEKPVLTDEEYQGTEPVAEELIKKVKSGKNYNKIYWDKVKDADGYYIYAAPCNTKKKKQGAKLVKDIESYKTTSFTHKGLKKGTWYKYRVVAYKISEGRKVTIAQSFLLHSVTSGGKYVNPKDVKVNKSKVTLKKGKSFTVNAKVVLAKGKKTKWHTKKIHFISSDTKIATVNSKGKIRAKKKGRCTIYAIAQNGVSKKIKVTVK